MWLWIVGGVIYSILTIVWFVVGMSCYNDITGEDKKVGARMLLCLPIWPIGLVLFGIGWAGTLWKDAFPKELESR